MAAELKERFGVDAELIRGKGGVFEVRLEDTSVFSKKSVGRFPQPGEVAATLAERLGA